MLRADSLKELAVRTPVKRVLGELRRQVDSDLGNSDKGGKSGYAIDRI